MFKMTAMYNVHVHISLMYIVLSLQALTPLLSMLFKENLLNAKYGSYFLLSNYISTSKSY